MWKDINLSSLHDHPSREDHHHHHSHTNLGGIILQDFLAGRPSSKDPPPSSSAGGGGDANLFGSPPPPPATVLSLNSGTQFHFLDNSDPLIRPNLNSHLHKHPLPNVMSAFGSPFDALASPVCLPSSGKKRLSESDNNTGGDRRHKRMIKNRESAARSRARKQEIISHLSFTNIVSFYKSIGPIPHFCYSIFESRCFSFLCFQIWGFLQAYTNELELEVKHLSAENAKLKKQQQQVNILL